jgi:hypothetical protein
VLSSYASSYVNTTMTEALNAKRNLIHERVSRVIVVPLETYLYGMSPEGCLFCGVVSRRRFVLWNGLQKEVCIVEWSPERVCFVACLRGGVLTSCLRRSIFFGSSSAKEQKR